MTSAFIPEHEIYGLLSGVGIKTPRHSFIDKDSKLADTPFDAWGYFLCLVGLLSLEWFLRKKWGMV